MTALLDVHIKDYGGREFGGEYTVAKISNIGGRVIVQLDYSGTKSNKKLTTAWLELDEAAVLEMQKFISGANVASDIDTPLALAV